MGQNVEIDQDGCEDVLGKVRTGKAGKAVILTAKFASDKLKSFVHSIFNISKTFYSRTACARLPSG